MPDWTDRAARRMYEGAGLGPEDVDVFNPTTAMHPWRSSSWRAFRWQGVKRGDAFAFYAGDIRVEGPHPFCSSGGNLGNGRTRTAMYTLEHAMRRVTAREANQRFSEVLSAVETGELVVITKRGRPVALMSPYPAEALAAERQGAIDRMIASMNEPVTLRGGFRTFTRDEMHEC